MEFFIVVIFAFLCDFDIFLSKFALDKNHRMLITHSIIPGTIVLIFGLIFNWIALIVSGLSYLIHVLIDTFDWGTNLFYFPKKQVGLKFLISKEEIQNLERYLSNYKRPESFFDKKYYGCKVCIIIEIGIFILMMISFIFFALDYFPFVLIYFLFLTFHLYRHFILKKIEDKN
ncbi:MAG: hypothetical protein ACXADU_04225 [Promethearchaeota archaeon]